MKYRLRLHWNSTLVMDAEITGTLAYDVIRQIMVENFAGETATIARTRVPSLDRILAMGEGDQTRNSIEDETGHASYWLQRKRGPVTADENIGSTTP